MRFAVAMNTSWSIRRPHGARATVARRPTRRRFVELMSRSVFALCPRGYGRTSYRMYEALQLGCIPVYIHDESWLPYADELDWREFAVLVPLADAPGCTTS